MQPPGISFEQGAAVGQQRAVYPDFAKLVNQYGPFFIRRLLRQQMKNRGRLTAAEKAGDQIGSGHSFLEDKCNVVTVTPILTKKGGKEKS